MHAQGRSQVTCGDVFYTALLLGGLVEIMGFYPFIFAGTLKYYSGSHVFWIFFWILSVPVYTGSIYGLRFFGRLTHDWFERFIGNPVNTVSVVMCVYGGILVTCVGLCHVCGIVIKLLWHESVKIIDLETFGFGLVWLTVLSSILFVCVNVFWNR